MPESIVQVDEGTGKKLHTWQRTVGSNDVEDEIVQLGEQHLPTFSAISGYGIACSTALAHPMQIMAGATNNVYIRRILFTQVAMATTAGVFDLGIVRLTTAGTGGTVITPSAFDSNDTGNDATAMTLPTALGTLGNTLLRRSAYWLQTMPVSGSEATGIILDWDADRLRSKPFRIEKGTTNGLAIRLTTAPAAATGVITVIYSLAPY